MRRCLAKDLEDRWQTMRDVVIELQNTAEGICCRRAIENGMVVLGRSGGGGRSRTRLIVAGILLYGATRPAPPRPLLRLSAEIAPDTPLPRVDIGNDETCSLFPPTARAW